MIDQLTITAAEAAMRREQMARDILSGDLSAALGLLFPGDADFVQRNGYVANELLRGAGEIADAVASAAINWTTASTDDLGVRRFFGAELVRLLALDALVSGKIALFPRSVGGQVQIAALSGYLHPVLSRDNALTVEAVLQVLPVLVGGKPAYEVRRYSRGLVEVYPPAEDWAEFAGKPAEEYPQPHAKGRLPIAFVVARRDANRYPAGLISECIPAFLRYLKTAVNRNAVQEIAGWPERVVQSDKYLDLALGILPAPLGRTRDEILAELKTVAPRQLKLLGTADTYAVQDGVDPRPHIDAEQIDKQALLDLLRSPDLSGGNLSGVALAERQTKSRALITDLCDSIAATVTSACQLAAELPSSGVPADLMATLTPLWATDNAARIEQVSKLYSAGAIPKSVALQELQIAGFGAISDELINAAQEQEQADALPVLEGGI